MTMNMRELPMWLKRCLIYDTISKMSEIPNDVSEIILRHLSSREQKNSHMMITELKDEIQKYNREEHIKFMKDESVWFDDPFYDHSIVGDHEDIGEDIIQEDLLSRRDSSACPPYEKTYPVWLRNDWDFVQEHFVNHFCLLVMVDRHMDF